MTYTGTVQGLTFGDGTAYPFAEAPAGLGVPEIRVADTPRPRADGIRAGADLLGGRALTFDLFIDGPDDAALEVLGIELASAFGPSPVDVDLVLELTGSPVAYTFRGRPRGAVLALDAMRDYSGPTGRALCTFMATDPRKLAPMVSVTVNLPGSTAGLEFPLDFPLVWGGGGDPGEATVVNTGLRPADWIATLSGPLTSPRVHIVELGRRIDLTGFTLAAGETLVLDSASRTVILNGTASRYSAVVPGSRWWQLPVGPSTIQLRAAAGTGAMLFTFEPAYL